MPRPHWVLHVAVSFFLALSIGQNLAAQNLNPAGSSLVDLKCRILPDPEEGSHSFWLLELRNATGAPLRKVLRAAGETVRFKNLLPGLYRIFVSGRGRSSFESIDLTVEPTQKNREFTRDIRLPRSVAANRDTHQVSVLALIIPKDALQELQLAEKFHADGNEEMVVSHLQRAVEIYPEYADAWNNLGASYHRQGNFTMAITSFRKRIELSPDHYVGYLNLGSSLMASGRFEEAAEASAKARSLGPDDAAVNSQLGLSYYYLHDYGQAQKHLKRVLDLDPGFMPSPYLFLSQIAVFHKAMPEAAVYLRAYLALHPNAGDAAHVKLLLSSLADGSGDKR